MKFFSKTMVMAILAVLALSLAVAAQTPNLGLTVAKVSSAPAIDGVLDDAAWVQASQVGAKAVIDMAHTGDAVSPFPWVAYMAYDDTALYLAYVTYTQDPEKLVGTAGIWSNDHVELFIVPEGLGTKQFGWDVAGAQNANAEAMSTWALGKNAIAAIYEVSIPWEKLGATPKAGDQWLGNLTGLQAADSGQWMCWNPSYGSFNNPSRFATFTFGE